MSEEMINLNDDSYNVTDISIFNNGKVGIAQDCDFSIEKKKAGDNMNSPDWKIIVIDKLGSVNLGLYYLDPKHENFSKYLRFQGSDLKHMFGAIYGPTATLPTFTTAKEMLDGIMLELKKMEGKVKIRVAVCYGTTKKPSAYLRLRNYPPFMEGMSIPFEKTELTFKPGDQMERLVPNTNTKDDFSTATVEQAKEDDDLPF